MEARGYGAVHPVSMSNAIKRAHEGTFAFPSTDEASADGDDQNYGTSGEGGGGAGSSNFSVDIVAESDTSGVVPAGRPLSFKM